MPETQWVAVLESDGKRAFGPFGTALAPGQSLTVGRDGELKLGIAIPDTAVSRCAATITSTGQGWELSISNSNGAVLHPWGQPPLPASGRVDVTWPLVALQVKGDKGVAHWVLLEASGVPLTSVGATGIRSGATMTVVKKRPRPLTDAQLEGLSAVFADVLRWPPVAVAQPLQLKQATNRLKLESVEALQARLRAVLGKAEQLGLGRKVTELTDPEYLYVLVRSGYVQPEMFGIRPHGALVEAAPAATG